MKKVVFALIGISFSLISFSQSRETVEGDSIPWELRKQSFIYNSAKLFNDPVVARTALYSLLAENPGNPALYDSLAMIYLDYNQNASAALVAQQSLQINPNNIFAINVAATAFDKLGVKDRALKFYDLIYTNNNDINTLYKVAFLQFELKRFAESNVSLDQIIKNEESKNIFIVFPTTDGKNQKVSLTAAAARVKAMILEVKGEKDAAMNSYLEVLKMSPGFEIVQKQLQELKKSE